MSKSERKVLIAKRHGERPFRSSSHHTSIPNNVPNQSGIKRNLEIEQTEQPPSKKPNRNCFNQQSSRLPQKNLAERRLQNLQNSLEKKRLLAEGLPSTAIASKSCSHTESKKVEGVSPLQMRLKRKYPDKSVEASVSNVEVARSTSSRTTSTFSESISSQPIKNNVINIEIEEMDWTEIDEKAVVNDIIDLRKEIDYNKESRTITEVNNSISFSTDGVFIVVDTNIFLSQLSLLLQLKDKVCTGLGRVTVVVPWMVIQELDYMKESRCSGSMVKAARKAVHYINTQLANKEPHFKGQSVMEAAKLEMSSKNPDDGILFCCMELVEKRKYTILLSNDVNLRNKALVNNVQAYNSSDVITSLNNLNSTNDSEDPPRGQSIQKIKISLSNTLTHIIKCEMKEAYGDVWNKMAMMEPPFTTEEALNCLMKYWVAVFSMSLQKQCKLKIEEFVSFLKLHRNDSTFHSTDFTKFVEFSLSLCIYLKNGFPNYRSLVNDCISIVQKCSEI